MTLCRPGHHRCAALALWMFDEQLARKVATDCEAQDDRRVCAPQREERSMKTVDELLDYWPGDIPFKGNLISDDGCMCAQGQVLHFVGGMSPDEMRKIEQAEADKRVAELMGISRAHAVLLRQVNDSQPGAPTCVIREPEKVFGGVGYVKVIETKRLTAVVEVWRVDSAPVRPGRTPVIGEPIARLLTKTGRPGKTWESYPGRKSWNSDEPRWQLEETQP
jgi:hypothetical protein